MARAYDVNVIQKMPSEFIILAECNLVVSRGTGVFGYGDFLEHMSRLSRHPEFKPEYNHLVDCCGFTRLDVSQEQLEELGSRSIFQKDSRLAFVASSDIHYGLSRMLAVYRELGVGQQTVVFREMTAALEWLGIPHGLHSKILSEYSKQ